MKDFAKKQLLKYLDEILSEELFEEILNKERSYVYKENQNLISELYKRQKRACYANLETCFLTDALPPKFQNNLVSLLKYKEDE